MNNFKMTILVKKKKKKEKELLSGRSDFPFCLTEGMECIDLRNRLADFSSSFSSLCHCIPASPVFFTLCIRFSSFIPSNPVPNFRSYQCI